MIDEEVYDTYVYEKYAEETAETDSSTSEEVVEKHKRG